MIAANWCTTALLTSASLLLGTGTVQAHCLVTGPAGTVVRGDSGSFSPVAALRDCASVRLVEGQATALWTGRDGRPAAGAVRRDQPPEGYPGASSTASAQRVAQALAAFTTDGRGGRPGYKRFDEGTESFDVHVPVTGLTLPAIGAGSWTATGIRGRNERVLLKAELVGAVGPVLSPALFEGHDALRIDLVAGERRQRLILRRLPGSDHQAVDRAILEALNLQALPSESQFLMLALVYETFGLSFNRDLALGMR